MCNMLIYCRIAIGNEKGLVLVDIDLEGRKYGGVQSTKGLARLEIDLEDKDGSAENTITVMASTKEIGQMIKEVSSLITK